MKIAYLATDPVTAFRFMDGQLGYMKQQGFDVTLISAPGSLLERTAAREGVRAIGVPMAREPSPLRDAKALAELSVVLRRLRPTIVNAGTPKAGLLGVAAARLVGVPIVVYLLRGLRFEGTRGAKRLMLAASEHVAGTLAHRVFVNSESLRARFTAMGCAPLDKTWVPANGSSNGVDAPRFIPTPERVRWGRAERERLGFPADAVVAGFVGRFTRDKGIVELLGAFSRASQREPRLRLLLVGDHDPTDPLPPDARRMLTEDLRIRVTGFVEEPAALYSVMDLFVFPSHREGFPNAPLEAASAELPVIACRATGTLDAVVPGVTGTLVNVGDEGALAHAMCSYATDPTLRRNQGRAGRQRAERDFGREQVWSALADEYRRLLAQHGLA